MTKAEHWRIDAFKLSCWRRLLRVPWTARRSNQSILNDISPECLLEGMMLKLKLQYFGHLMQRTDSLEETLKLEKLEDRRKRGRQKMRCLDGITDLMDWVWASSGSWWWTGKPGVLLSMGSQRVRHDWATELNWTEGSVKWEYLGCSGRFREGTKEVEGDGIAVLGWIWGQNTHQWIVFHLRAGQSATQWRPSGMYSERNTNITEMLIGSSIDMC